ncbi:MAG: aldo/keto reductase [Collinsella sp.]|nr:aldo/keto reductase [Collinsella sp.]
MLYKNCERCGIEVSALGAGTWSMGGTNAYGRSYGEVEDATSIKALHALIDGGVNLIDTAPVYGDGGSENVVGAALAQDGYRDRVFLVTKFGNSQDPKTGERIIDNSRERIMSEIDESLKRLRTDRIDLYIMHYPDGGTPIQETMEALGDLKRQGKIRYVGVSNVDRDQIEDAARFGRVDAVQLPYAMVNRQQEDLFKWCHEQGYLTMAYGSLGAGILSGAFRELPHFDEKDIRNTFYPYFKEPMFSKIQGLLSDMDVLAERYGRPLAHIALSWAAHKEYVDTSLVGVANVDQARENCEAFSLSLSDDEMAFLDDSIARHLDA